MLIASGEYNPMHEGVKGEEEEEEKKTKKSKERSEAKANNKVELPRASTVSRKVI